MYCHIISLLEILQKEMLEEVYDCGREPKC